MLHGTQQSSKTRKYDLQINITLPSSQPFSRGTRGLQQVPRWT